jgi:hypothetical protein
MVPNPSMRSTSRFVHGVLDGVLRDGGRVVGQVQEDGQRAVGAGGVALSVSPDTSCRSVPTLPGVGGE